MKRLIDKIPHYVVDSVAFSLMLPITALLLTLLSCKSTLDISKLDKSIEQLEKSTRRLKINSCNLENLIVLTEVLEIHGVNTSKEQLEKFELWSIDYCTQKQDKK